MLYKHLSHNTTSDHLFSILFLFNYGKTLQKNEHFSYDDISAKSYDNDDSRFGFKLENHKQIHTRNTGWLRDFFLCVFFFVLIGSLLFLKWNYKFSYFPIYNTTKCWIFLWGPFIEYVHFINVSQKRILHTFSKFSHAILVMHWRSKNRNFLRTYFVDGL